MILLSVADYVKSKLLWLLDGATEKLLTDICEQLGVTSKSIISWAIGCWSSFFMFPDDVGF